MLILLIKPFITSEGSCLRKCISFACLWIKEGTFKPMLSIPRIESHCNLLKSPRNINPTTNRLLQSFQFISIFNFICFFTFVLRIYRFRIPSIYFYMDQTIFSSPLAMLHLSTPLGAYSTHRIKKAGISSCSALSIVVTRSYMLRVSQHDQLQHW